MVAKSTTGPWAIYVCPGCGEVSLEPQTHYAGHAKNAGEHYVAYCYDERTKGEWFVDESLPRPFERIEVVRSSPASPRTRRGDEEAKP